MDWTFSLDWSLSLQLGWIGLHFVGLAAAWIVRVHAGMKSEVWAQVLFMASFCSLVLVTMAGLRIGSTNWTFSAGILSIMILAAVVDFGSQGKHTAVHLELAPHRD